MKPLEILIIEDREYDAELIILELKKFGLEFQFKVVDTKEGYCKNLHSDINIIISDYYLPQFNCLQALAILQERRYDIPLIVVSGTISEEKGIACLKAGATDYLLKDRLSRLGPAILNALEQKKLRNEQNNSAFYHIFFTEASSILSSSQDITITLNHLCDLIITKLCDYCCIWVKRDQKLEQASACLKCSKLPFFNTIHISDLPLFAKCHVTSLLELEKLAAGSSQEKYYRDWMLEQGLTTVIALPLIVRQLTFGEIILGFKVSPKLNKELTLKIADEIGRRTAVTIDNAMLFQQAEIARDRALQLYNEAQKAQRLKDEFLAIVTHELRTPLSAILGFSEILNEMELSTEAKEMIAIILRNAKSQLQITSDLLEMTKIISGKIQLNSSAVYISKAVISAIESVQLAAKAKHITIVTHLSENEKPVLGDLNRLQQVILNILTNAIKFTTATGKIDISLNNHGSNVELIISDSGKGIAPDFLPYIFDRFRQENSTLSREFGGLGIGLDIAKHIVELHGGEISAKSDGLGKGAKFCVSFPILAAKEGEAEIEPTPQSPSLTEQGRPLSIAKEQKKRPPPLPLDGVKIMVIDDHKDSRDLVALILEKAGASVISLESAKKALCVLKDPSPHVILCDISMPEMDGYTFIRTLRANKKKPFSNIPAAALTAFDGSSFREQAINSGYEEYITKPVEGNQLLGIVTNLLSKSSHPKTKH